MRIVGGDETHPSLLEIQEERCISGQPVQLRYDQRGAVNSASVHRTLELRAIGLSTALDFYKLCDQRPVAAIKIASHGSTLSL
jgi:hypothetical protein